MFLHSISPPFHSILILSHNCRWKNYCLKNISCFWYNEHFIIILFFAIIFMLLLVFQLKNIKNIKKCKSFSRMKIRWKAFFNLPRSQLFGYQQKWIETRSRKLVCSIIIVEIENKDENKRYMNLTNGLIWYV